jgi:hypothetical protein
MNAHKGNYIMFQTGTYQWVSSFEIIKHGDAIITLVENIPCNSKEELLRAERRYIEQTICVNKIKPITSPEERVEYNRQYSNVYRQVNNQKITEYQKEYYLSNADKLKASVKENYEKNRNIRLQYASEYNRANAEKIKERKRVVVVCDNCGCSIARWSLSNHKKSKKCLNHVPATTTINV